MPAAPSKADWRGKAKHMLQILYERGWVNPSLKTVKGKWAAGWGTTRKRKYQAHESGDCGDAEGQRAAHCRAGAQLT